MANNTQPLTIGTKYVYTGTSSSISSEKPLIFIGFNQGKAQFIDDNQALYDLLGAPFSSEALNNYANNHDLDELSKKVDVTYSDDATCWLSEDAVKARIDEITAALESAKKLLNKHEEVVFYAADCPGGETYTQFINDFKKQCSDAGLCTLDFTFHGNQGENKLSVAHHGTEVITDTYSEPAHDTVFFKLIKAPAYRRMDINYMRSTTLEELKQYKW